MRTLVAPSLHCNLLQLPIPSTFTFAFSLSSSTTAPIDDSLCKSLADKNVAVEAQGNIVRALKAVGAPKTKIDATPEILNALKLEKTSTEHSLVGGSDTREAFGHAVVNTLERSLFYIPLFKIYRDVANLFEYGPPGCATLEVVLKALGHVEKFTDLMVKDEKIGTCYYVNQLLKDFCNEKLKHDLALSSDKVSELKHVLATSFSCHHQQSNNKINIHSYHFSITATLKVTSRYHFSFTFDSTFSID